MFSLHLPKTFLGSSSFPHCPHPDQQLLRIPKLFHSPWFRFKAKTPFCIPFLPSKQMPVYGPLRHFILLTHKKGSYFIFLYNKQFYLSIVLAVLYILFILVFELKTITSLNLTNLQPFMRRGILRPRKFIRPPKF